MRLWGSATLEEVQADRTSTTAELSRASTFGKAEHTRKDFIKPGKVGRELQGSIQSDTVILTIFKFLDLESSLTSSVVLSGVTTDAREYYTSGCFNVTRKLKV